MPAYDETRNTAQPAFQPGRNAATTPMTSFAVQRPMPQQLPGGGGLNPNPTQGPQPGMVTPAGAPFQSGAAFNPSMSPILAQWLQSQGMPPGGPQAGAGIPGYGTPGTGGPPATGAFGRPGGMMGPMMGGTSGFGSRIGPFRSGGGNLGTVSAFGRR